VCVCVCDDVIMLFFVAVLL